MKQRNGAVARTGATITLTLPEQNLLTRELLVYIGSPAETIEHAQTARDVEDAFPRLERLVHLLRTVNDGKLPSDDDVIDIVRESLEQFAGDVAEHKAVLAAVDARGPAGYIEHFHGDSGRAYALTMKLGEVIDELARMRDTLPEYQGKAATLSGVLARLEAA